MATFRTMSGQSYTLASSISSTQTTILLTSFKVPVSNTSITMASMGTSIAYGTLAPGTSQAELISFTGVSQNSDGTATLTGVTRGLDKQYPGTESSSFKQPHAGQTIFILSDAPQVFNEMAALKNDNTWTGRQQFPTAGTASSAVVGASYAAPSADNEVATKKYVDDTASFGAPKATDSVFGITRLSTAAVVGITPIAVGDNDPRVPTQSENDALVGTSGAPSSTNKYVTNADTSTSATVGALARRNTTGDVTVNATPTASTDAASKGYVDGGTYRSFTNGDTTKNAADASGTQNIAHGLGRTPKRVIIKAICFGLDSSAQPTPASAETFYNGTTQSSVSFYATAANFSSGGTVTNTFTLNVGGAGGTQSGVVTFDSTNIIITWTKTNSPTGVYTLIWTAE